MLSFNKIQPKIFNDSACAVLTKKTKVIEEQAFPYLKNMLKIQGLLITLMCRTLSIERLT